MSTARPVGTADPSSFWHRGQLVLAGVGLICLLAITVLVTEIIRDLRYLNTAKSDNVHWVLSQAEVEFLEFRNALERARNAGGADAEVAALDQAIVEFDVFYSRMTTLATGSLYTELRQIESFGGPVAEIRQRLDAMIPQIDGPQPALQAALPELAAQADAMRPLLREAATTGLQFFAARSDEGRNNFAATLLRLALLAVVLVLALMVLLAHTRRVGNQTEARGQELEEAYARLNTILETSLDAVVVSDMDGRILNFNSAAERIFQRNQKDVLGRNIAEVIIPDHLRDAHDAGMKRMRETGEQKVVGHGRVRLEAKRRDGEVFPVELALEKAQAGGDEIVVAFLRDISHRVAAETELVEARDKALAGEKAKAEFLAMMTHEIRTPLNGLLGNLALLEKTSLSQTQDRYVRNMNISGGVLMHHVDAVLDVARFESGTVNSREDVVHLGRLIQDIVDSQASAAEVQGNHIQWGWIGDPVAWIRVDSSRLQQVLLNLIGNAIKFTRDGRIVIEAERTVLGADEGLEIRVIDTGIGIPEPEQERVFGDFQTVDTGPAEGGAGTGLGLGIARRFVVAMGGEIGVESTPGEGSVFWLRLPMEQADGPELDNEAGAAADVAAPQSVLLVEDNEINLELARELLAGLGHRVSEARDGEEAVRVAALQRFDLILMDIRMPRLDGLGATRAIRSGHGFSRDTPIIALSANVLPEAKDRFLAAGMSGFLPKPLTEADLRRVIGEYCALGDAPAEATASSARDGGLDHLRRRYEAETQAFFSWLATRPDDLPEIAAQAHKIAGSAAAFGQPGLRDALVALETAAEQGDRALIETAITDAVAALERAPAATLPS